MIKNKKSNEKFAGLSQNDTIKETLITSSCNSNEHQMQLMSIEMREVYTTDKNKIGSSYGGVHKRTTVLLRTVEQKEDEEDHELINIQEIKSQFKAESDKYRQ